MAREGDACLGDASPWVSGPRRRDRQRRHARGRRQHRAARGGGHSAAVAGRRPARMVGDDLGWMALGKCRLAPSISEPRSPWGTFPSCTRCSSNGSIGAPGASLGRRRSPSSTPSNVECWPCSGTSPNAGPRDHRRDPDPLNISHRLLAQLIGARRPTVSTAVGALIREGNVTRRPDGAWIVRDEPLGASPNAERLLSRPPLITDLGPSEVEASRMDVMDPRRRRRPRLRRQGPAPASNTPHCSPSHRHHDATIRVLDLVWDCPAGWQRQRDRSPCVACRTPRRARRSGRATSGSLRPWGGLARPEARPRAAGTRKTRAIGTAAAASELDHEGLPLRRSQIAKACSILVQLGAKSIRERACRRAASTHPSAPPGTRGGSHSKSKSASVPVSSKMRCTAGGPGIDNLNSARRAASA